MDRELRDLERAFAQSGAVDDEVRLLTHRVRAGLLPTAWLETAARLGHEAARRALGRFVPVIARESLPEALDLLPGLRTGVRLLAGACRPLVRSFERGRTDDRRPAEAVEALLAWSESPDEASPAAEERCAAAARAAEAAAADADRASDDLPTTIRGVSDQRPISHREAADLARLVARIVRHPAGRSPTALENLLRDLSDHDFRGARDAGARWALLPPAVPPPRWPEGPAGPSPDVARREATVAFEARLADKATKKAATALRARLREKTLTKEMVELAADLGHAAAWLVARREGTPDLTPAASANEVEQRLERLLDRRAAPVKTRTLQRRHWVDDAGKQRTAASWRSADGGVRRPDWTPVFLARVALRLAERAAALEAATRATLAAIRAQARCPCGKHAEAAERRGRSALLAASDGPEGAALRAVGSAAVLAGRAGLDQDRSFELHQCVAAAVEALGPPAAVWDDLREALAAWALGEETGEVRPYDPAATWGQGDLLDHPKFGRGRVAKVEAGKLEVVFADGSKTLALRGPARPG